MAENEVTPTAPISRSAKFKRHEDSESLPTDMTLGRRAAFRPSEHVAVRRDILEAYRQKMVRDVAGTMDDEDVRNRAMFAAALADEATRNHDRAALQFSRLRRQYEFWPDEWAVVRRVHRRQGDPEVVADALERAFAVSRGLDKALTGLERARHAWENGEPPKDVASWVRRVMSEFDNGGRRALHMMPRFTAAWAVQIACDAAIEADHYDRALVLMDAFMDHPELDARDRQAVAATLGLWHYALGHPDQALEYLRAVGETGELHADFEDAFVHLLFLEGDRDTALSVLRRAAEALRVRGPRALVLAMLECCAGFDERALAVLRSAREGADDPIVLDLCLEVLELAGEPDEVIDVLNQRLETPLDTERRAALLARLGRLYEADAGLEEAAADVYREALALVPDYGPAIRALGRLYSRRRNWHALVALFEHEIESLEGTSTVWRRRYQAARLYEIEIGDADRALHHYRAVLHERQSYLPALKGAARILASAERWTELADLFLQAAGSAGSSRQKLYLLDRVAEVAEVRLERFDVAIGAWEEILHLDPQHPRAFSALGRLYVRTARWHDLLGLNERELELVDDDEEAAALLVRNAEIAEAELGRPDAAEGYYRRVLERLPDYLPALEGLGRIYARGGRWDDIVSMTDAQLVATDDPREIRRQLGALAEIYEGRMDRADEAIRVYERMLGSDPADSHALFNLARLYRLTQRWQDAFDLIERHRPQGWEGELAMLAEWRLCRWDVAFQWYLRALEKAPTCEHWLDGVARLWRPARIEPGELADRLEGLLMAQMPADVRDRYFIVLARLREAAEGTPDAGRAYRAHGDADNLESLVVVRLAMAANGERDGLLHARRVQPVLPWDELVNADRVRPTKEILAAIDNGLSDEERRWLVRETDLASSRHFVRPTDGAWTRIAAEMQRILEEPPVADEPSEEEAPEYSRLRAVEALAADQAERFASFTLAEIAATSSREIRIHRFLELAEAVPPSQRTEYLEQAIMAAFWEHVPGEDPGEVADGPVYDRLYDTLQDNMAWDGLRRSLETHTRREGVTENRRVYLNDMLARVCEEQHEDFAAARAAFERCWEISTDRRFLRDIVRVAREEGDLELAIAWQARHHEETRADQAAGADERLQSANWHAELLRLAGRGPAAIACLEDAVAADSGGVLEEPTLRELARIHTEAGDKQRAVELFQKVLPIHATADDVADWRTLVALHRDALGDLPSAYALQWKLVRAQPASQTDLDALVDFALDLDEVADCAAQLEALAAEHEGAPRIALLGRAALAVDEDLNWAEEAVRLFEILIAQTATDAQKNLFFRRRHAFCLSRIAGREPAALEEFRRLADAEPFEPSTYRGMVDLLERTQAYDRARVANQLLVALGCTVDAEFERPKTTPSREFEPRQIEELLLPAGLRDGVIGCLRAVLPLAEKIWADELPQRKALDGARHKDGKLYEATADALSAFGIKKFKLVTGDAGPLSPQVFGDGTIWMNSDVIGDMTDAERRFVAGYCAALAWSDLSAILTLDGRRIWHLLEGVQLRQTGRGFSERVDVESQRLGDEVASPLYAVARRRVSQAIELAGKAVFDSHCEAWPGDIDHFAHRVGMVLCGDIPASMNALLKLGGWGGELEESATQARLRRTTSAEGLLRYASTDAFLEARHAIGLAGRPTTLSV